MDGERKRKRKKKGRERKREDHMTAAGVVSWPTSPLSCKRIIVFHSSKSLFFFGNATRHSPTCGPLLLSARTRSRSKGKAAVPFATTGKRPFSPVMEWQDCDAEIEVDVPASVAYDYFSDRESFPHWMPFISTVKVFKDKPELSRWTLKYTILGRDVESSWIARNLQPIRNQKIHWRSLEGFPNRGAVRFYPKGSSSCKVELKISYEVPQIFAPVASALKPITRGLLRQGLEQFSVATKSYVSRVS